MMLQRAYIQQIGGVFFNAFLVGMVTLLICENITKADEVPAFFLKIAKIPTLPRVGRSDRFEDFFYKAEKHIPRIGRNSQQVADFETNILIIFFRLCYCIFISNSIIVLCDYTIIYILRQSVFFLLLQDETYTDLTKRRIDYPPKVDGWSSQNFPLAIEGPRELWRTLAGYSRDGSDE
ncbi:hypothetical protein DMN91_006694 [Ooceraea biroi]|uniref:Uncharacterized protein n=1 Tax=Ooceraea biroi TaxID=2015173 RepID=A0A3L8DJQ7_OOCBI|nr:hypothetical protein DMN91_006694 [Ooceraea biroi]